MEVLIVNPGFYEETESFHFPVRFNEIAVVVLAILFLPESTEGADVTVCNVYEVPGEGLVQGR